MARRWYVSLGLAALLAAVVAACADEGDLHPQPLPPGRGEEGNHEPTNGGANPPPSDSTDGMGPTPATDAGAEGDGGDP